MQLKWDQEGTKGVASFQVRSRKEQGSSPVVGCNTLTSGAVLNQLWRLGRMYQRRIYRWFLSFATYPKWSKYEAKGIGILNISLMGKWFLSRCVTKLKEWKYEMKYAGEKFEMNAIHLHS